MLILEFSRTKLHSEATQICVLSGNQEASPSAANNTRVSFEPLSTWKYVSSVICNDVDIPAKLHTIAYNKHQYSNDQT